MTRNQTIAALEKGKPRVKKRTLRANADGVPRTGVLRRDQVMSLFGISDATLRRRVSDGVIPPPLPHNPLGNFRVWKAPEVWGVLDKCMGEAAAP